MPDERPGTKPGGTGGTAAVLAPRPQVPPSPFTAPGNPFASAFPRPLSPPTTAPSVPTTPPSKDPRLTQEFRDGFDRQDLGPDWASTSPAWRIQGGRLCAQGARNHPVWLRRALPTNARIEFDATTALPEGDIKAEFWGDGQSAAQTVSYNAATSYITIFGGWKNQFHVLARIDEHASNRPEIRIDDEGQDFKAKRVQPNRAYHFKVVRDDGKTVRWLVDDIEMFAFTDPAPLSGPGHDHFGFNDWDVALCFDNLTIVPLP